MRTSSCLFQMSMAFRCGRAGRWTIGALAGVNCMPLGFDNVMIRPRANSRSHGRDTVTRRMPPFRHPAAPIIMAPKARTPRTVPRECRRARRRTIWRRLAEIRQIAKLKF